MNAPTIQISKEKAKKIYKDYLEIVKTRKEKYLQDLKQVYYHLSKGDKILDIYEVFKKAGVNKDGEPKLAIVRADAKKCVFRKKELGSGSFTENFGWRDKEMSASFDINLPTNTFPKWKTELRKEVFEKEATLKIIRPDIQTKTTICPPHLLPNGELSNYYLLWEVDKWNEVPVAKDPFLLKRINSNAFIVLAEWDLTEVEQAVIRGL
jgi:hypothetical protein